MTILFLKIILTLCFSSLVIGIAILIVADDYKYEEVGIAIMAIGTFPMILAILCKCFCEIWIL